MDFKGYEVPEDLYYDEHHSWGRVDGNVMTVGLTDFAQKLAGEFIHIALPKVGKEVAQGRPMASVESGKWVGRVWAPASGEVIEVNEKLEEKAGLINSSPYGDGWIARVRLSNPAELGCLAKGEAILPFLEREIAKHSS